MFDFLNTLTTKSDQGNFSSQYQYNMKQTSVKNTGTFLGDY